MVRSRPGTRGGAAALFAAGVLVGVLTGAEVDPLSLGLVGYLACDGDLRLVTPAGEEGSAGFERLSQAFTDALQEVPVNEPRFAPGLFGLGVLVEPGYESPARYECRNWLPPVVAEVLPRPGTGFPFAAVAGARLGILQAAEGEARGPEAPVLEGAAALHVTCAEPGSGVETRAPVSVLNGNYTASVHVRGDPDDLRDGDRAVLQIVDSARGAVLAESAQAVTASWRRVEVDAAVGAFTRDVSQQAYTPVTLRVTGARPGQVLVLDAFMLEMRGGYSYAGTSGASSWLPGHACRAPEVLDADDLRPCFAGQTGSAALRFRLRGGPQAWRTLFELAGPNRWEPHLQVRLAGDRRLHLGRRRQEPRDLAVDAPLAAGVWHHVAVTWTADRATVYLDGVRKGSLDGLEIPARPSAIRLGSGGPNAAANAVLDEIFLYDRELAEEEVGRLARSEVPGAGLAMPAVTLRPRRFIECLAHGWEPQPWTCDVRNQSGAPLPETEVSLRLGAHLELRRALGTLPAGSVTPVEFRFLPDLAVGTYPLTVAVRSAGREAAVFRRQVDVTPAPEPAANLQVLPWKATFSRAYGFTCGGGDLAETMREGLAWAPHVQFLGCPRTLDGEDVVHDMNGKPGLPRLNSPFIFEQVHREAARLAEQLAPAPALRAVTFNSETQWIWSHDFSPENAAWVRQTFHLELDAWRDPPGGDTNAAMLPYGRLRPGVAGLARPDDGIVDPATPFYAYHRWFHGPLAPTEAFLNQTLSDALTRRRPDVLTIQEPILRRPAVRAFDRMGIAQEWFYYQDPLEAVMVQECLNAAVRGTGMRPSGMPQFLFKAGTAAPYSGLPTADLFREAAWLCALQPVRLFTYWNFDAVPRAGFENAYVRCVTKAELDALLGSPRPSWPEARRALESGGAQAAKLLAWTPELAEAFRTFHRDQVGPLGALIPQWRNRPRRVAILRSFASQLYGDVRWPGTTWLERCVMECGVPFDVLLDEDFEGGEDPLAGYQLLVVSGAVCLTRPAAEALQRFADRGGVIVTDPETKVALPGARVLRPRDAAPAPARPDGMEPAPGTRLAAPGPGEPADAAAAAPLPPGGPGPGLPDPAFLDVLESAVTPEARSLTPFTWPNLLEAEGAFYLGVVNDLRLQGPLYGHFGRVRETGAPHHALVRVAAGLGAVAYDLLSQEQVLLTPDGPTLTAGLDLPPGGARVLVLLPGPVARLELEAELTAAQWGDHRGRQVAVRGLLLDDQGRIVPGLVPATITWVHPDGSRSDFSHHTVFRRGVLECALPVLANGPRGAWRVRVLERASGRAAEAVVTVP